LDVKRDSAIHRLWRLLRGQSPDDTQQRLLELYWNRAELKKELLKLQDQQNRLLAKFDAQQAAAKVADGKLDELAELLGRPEAVSNYVHCGANAATN
jgi:hypothetical protein